MSMASTGHWYVLIETNTVYDGDNLWSLTEKLPVEGGREEAIGRAEELSLSYEPGPYPSAPETCGRTVFRTSQTSWLVESEQSLWHQGWTAPATLSQLMRITVAELVSARPAPPAEPPVKRGRLRRARRAD
ncbi:hypothetical protein AB0M39_19765 [Streptomyces sp. NPDC051907]|uniref:hypothetical protein n=1 Tax=Streptomyces sp. NPDC051907 TaxID=3155284 RepID=UPI00342764C1